MLQTYPMYAYIPARDVARARDYYEKKVGLKPGQVIAEAGDIKAAWFKDTEGNIMALIQAP